MKKSALTLALLCLAITSFADTTLITNLNGYTLNSDRELVQFSALQFTDDKVDRTYTEDDELPSNIEDVIEGDGRTLIPGLIDAHGHVGSYGFSLLRVDLVGASSEEEAAQRVLAFVEENSELEWIQGRGWNQVLWESNEFPSAVSIDALVSDKPVWLTRVDGHAGWANTVAMELAGIDQNTENPTGGQIIRNEKGDATGVLIDTAMRYVSSQIPNPTFEEQKFALQTAMESLAKYGMTSVHDAGIGSQTVAAFKELVDEGPLPIRVNAMLSASDPLYQDRLDDGFFSSDDDTFVIHSVKVVGDGALGSRGAALIEDYSCLLYTSPSPRDGLLSRMPSSA